QTRHAWGQTATTLAQEGYSAVTLDLRGHGESDWDPNGAYELGDFSSDLEQVLQKMPTKPVLVGASLGGLTALTLEGAAHAPHSRGLVLVDVTPRISPVGVSKILSFMGARSDGFSSVEEAADAVNEYLPHRKRPKDLSGLARNLRRGEDGR